MEESQTAKDARQKKIGCWMLLITFAILPLIAINFGHDTMTLKAKPWNEGKVHIWNNLKEDASTFPTDLSENTACKRLDNHVYELPPDPPIRYYKVDCNGVIGYVETDQVR